MQFKVSGILVCRINRQYMYIIIQLKFVMFIVVPVLLSVLIFVPLYDPNKNSHYQPAGVGVVRLSFTVDSRVLGWRGCLA